jgi:hypothetical protein
MSTARVDFTRGAAERIARAVRIVETGDRNEAPLEYGRGDLPAKVFRMARFTGAWSVNSYKEVQFFNTTQTISARNVFVSITVSTGVTSVVTRPCGIAKDGTVWYLIAALC